MAFFKRLRPVSRASFKEKPIIEDDRSNHSDRSHESADPSDHSNGGASTPGSSLPSSASTTSVNRLGIFSSKEKDVKPQRPSVAPLGGSRASNSSGFQPNQRRSMSHISSSTAQAPQVVGHYVPKVTNIESGTWVHTKLVLLRGYCGDSSRRSLDGRLVITHDKDSFPQTSFTVHDGQFKALVHLNPGPNHIRLEFFSQKLADNNGPISLQRTDLRINYLPMNNAPPLRLAILVANDSNFTFDTTPERMQTEGNDVDLAVKKFRMAAQLWQTYTADKMRQAALGRRAFRLEEEYTMSSLSAADQEANIMRNEPVVSIIQMNKTTDELRMMSEAQILDDAVIALRDFLRPHPEQLEHVAAMLLDTHWEPLSRQIMGHAAINGGDRNIKVALYGSSSLHAYPSCIEEVGPAFEDSTRTNPAFVGNLDNASGSSWEAANNALCGHLRQVSRMFGCENQASGMMCPTQPPQFSRTFITKESYCTAEQRKGIKPVYETDESGWSHFDLLRFRSHPCFRIPNDPPPAPKCEIQFWPLSERRIRFSARNGITFIEAYGENDRYPTLIRDFISQPDSRNPENAVIRSAVPNQHYVSEKEIRDLLPKNKNSGKVRVVAHSAGIGRSEIPDLARFFEDRKVKMPNGKQAYRSPRIGHFDAVANERQDLILHTATDLHRLLQNIKIFCDSENIFGLEFNFEGYVSQMFGSKGHPGETPVDIATFGLDTRNAQFLSGFEVRVGPYGIAGIRFATSTGSMSRWYGKQTTNNKSTDHQLIAPPGFSVAGVSGTIYGQITSFAVLIKV